MRASHRCLAPPRRSRRFRRQIAHLIALARLAERGLFDMFFMADTVTFWRGTLASMARDSYCAWIEPFTLMC